MIVQDLYRVIFDIQEVEICFKNGVTLWYGNNEDMPNKYFEKVVNAIYSLKGVDESYIVILIDEA